MKQLFRRELQTIRHALSTENPRAMAPLALIVAVLCSSLVVRAQTPPASGMQPTSQDPFASNFAGSKDALDAWRVYTGKDGTSHLEKVLFRAKIAPFFGDKGVFKVGAVVEKKESKVYLPAKATRVLIYSAPGNVDLPEHVSPGSEMFLVLRGKSHLLLRDGTDHEFGPGDIIIFEDKTGPGHSSHIGPDGFTAVNFSFDDGSPIGALVSRP